MRNRPSSPPIRTCVGCRETREKRELIRFCGGKGQRPEIDLSGYKPGRGVYLCAHSRCIREAVRRGALSRSLKCKAEVEGARGLEERILAALEGELNRLLPAGVDFKREKEIQNSLISPLPEKKAERAAELWYKYRRIKNNEEEH